MSKTENKKKEGAVQEPEYAIKSVKVEFDKDEINTMAKQITGLMSEVEQIESDAKVAATSFKNKIADKESQINILRTNISDGYHYVSKKCVLIKNFEKTVREYYLDGVLVDSEPLTKEDYQLELKLQQENAAKDNATEEPKTDESKTEEAK